MVISEWIEKQKESRGVVRSRLCKSDSEIEKEKERGIVSQCSGSKAGRQPCEQLDIERRSSLCR